MKAMSKFFLIVSGAIALIGVVLMIIASGMAKKTGYQLYQKKVGGKYLYELDLEGSDVAKISVNATDTDIRVMTGESRNYIEFINFNPNYYSIDTRNKIVTFDEHASLNSILSVWEGEYSFKGMRSFLNLGGVVSGQKEVLIHLKDTSGINCFFFTITTGDITFGAADSMTDYNITMTSGTVTMKDVKTTSTVKISANDCKLKFENCSFKNFEGDIEKADMTLEIDGIHSFDFGGKCGILNGKLSPETPECSVKLSSTNMITYNSTVITESEYTNADDRKEIKDTDDSIKVDGKDLKINLEVTFPDAGTEEKAED